ncbi:hypothetical protein EDB85DRAFT_1565978 [Lactarius pseudohatsudake]|nr:hypothetical protein EDB85DRAFT_1565978 [Lactarius pseudohatsudake]
MRCTLIRRRRTNNAPTYFAILHRNTLTFDRTAEDFECPACRNYRNCSLCSRKREEAYVPERDGGSRSWIARQGGSHRAAPTPAKKSKNKNLGAAPATTKPATMMTTTTTDVEVPDGSWSTTAVFTVSGEPLGSAFLQGKPTAFPAAATTAPTAPATIPASPIPNPRRNSGNCKDASMRLLGNRATRGGGSWNPTTTSRSSRRKRRRGGGGGDSTPG